MFQRPHVILPFLLPIHDVGGGMMGYLKSNSLMSLIAGGGFGVILLYLQEGQQNTTGIIIVCSLLLVLMSFRFLSSGKFMPAGLLSILSLVNLIIQITFDPSSGSTINNKAY